MKISCRFSSKGVAAALFAATAVSLLFQCESAPAGGGNNEDGGGDADAAHRPDTAWYADNPGAGAFNISTDDGLAGLALLVNRKESPVDFAGKTVNLTADIDLSKHYGKDWENYDDGVGWIAIGSMTADKKTSTPFKGTFDGNGHTIAGLYIEGNMFHNFQGLFGRIEGSAVVKNLSLTGINIKGGTGLGGAVGSAAGNSKVINCYAKGAVKGNSNVGGVAGEVEGGEVGGCRFIGTVSGSGDEIGGIVGGVNGVKVANCCSHNGAVSGGRDVGGIVGGTEAKSASTVTNCYSTLDVSSSSSGAGGVAGYIYDDTRITNCAALNKSVRGAGDVGRVAGADNEGGATLSGNIALSGMEGAVWSRKGADDIDGADIDKEAVNLDGTLGGRFKAADGWTTENGKLPGLGGPAVEMPEHLK